MTDLDYKIRSFKENYMIVETESLLQDTASKLRAMAHQAATVSPHSTSIMSLL